MIELTFEKKVMVHICTFISSMFNLMTDLCQWIQKIITWDNRNIFFDDFTSFRFHSSPNLLAYVLFTKLSILLRQNLAEKWKTSWCLEKIRQIDMICIHAKNTENQATTISILNCQESVGYANNFGILKFLTANKYVHKYVVFTLSNYNYNL